MKEELETKKKPSKLWYLLPIFFGILGGIAGYLATRGEDRKFAKKLIIIGIIMTIVWFIFSTILNVIISFFAYQHIKEVFEKKTHAILEVVEASCFSNRTVTVYLRNFGTKTLYAKEQTCTQILGKCLQPCIPVDLEPYKIEKLTINGCDYGPHKWEIKGPTTSLTFSVFCP
jgi:uncharacterized membrane protein